MYLRPPHTDPVCWDRARGNNGGWPGAITIVSTFCSSSVQIQDKLQPVLVYKSIQTGAVIFLPALYCGEKAVKPFLVRLPGLIRHGKNLDGIRIRSNGRGSVACEASVEKAHRTEPWFVYMDTTAGKNTQRTRMTAQLQRRRAQNSERWDGQDMVVPLASDDSSPLEQAQGQGRLLGRVLAAQTLRCSVSSGIHAASCMCAQNFLLLWRPTSQSFRKADLSQMRTLG